MLKGRDLFTTLITGTSDACIGNAGSTTSLTPIASRIAVTASALTGTTPESPVPVVPGPTSPAL